MKDEIKRNSRIIKTIKYILLAVAFLSLLVIGYFALVNQNSKVSQKDAQEDQKDQTLSRFRVSSPDLNGLSLDHGPYYIKAIEMQETGGEISFIDPQVKLMVKHLDWLAITSKHANLINADNQLTLYEEVRANLNHQYYLESEQVVILPKESIIKSAQYSKFYTKDYDLESDKGFIVYHNDQAALFYGKINANIKDPKDNKVTNIKSDTFDVSWLKKIGNFTGNVVMTQNGARIESNEMIAVANKASNQIERIYLHGKVKIIDEEQTATSEYGEYIMATSVLILKNNVKLYKNNNVITGETLYYNSKLRQANLVGSEKKSEGKRVKAVIIPADKHK